MPYGTIFHIRIGELNVWDFISSDGRDSSSIKRASSMADAEMERIAEAERAILKENRRR